MLTEWSRLWISNEKPGARNFEEKSLASTDIHCVASPLESQANCM